MSRQEQLALQLRSPSHFDETQVKLFVRPINFIAHNGMTNRSEMHANLVCSSGVWNCTDYAKLLRRARAIEWRARRLRPTSRSHKPSLNVKFSLCGGSGWVNHLFKPDRRAFMLALSIEGGINDSSFPGGPTPDDGQIFFL